MSDMANKKCAVQPTSKICEAQNGCGSFLPSQQCQPPEMSSQDVERDLESTLCDMYETCEALRSIGQKLFGNYSDGLGIEEPPYNLADKASYVRQVANNIRRAAWEIHNSI